MNNARTDGDDEENTPPKDDEEESAAEHDEGVGRNDSLSPAKDPDNTAKELHVS